MVGSIALNNSITLLERVLCLRVPLPNKPNILRIAAIIIGAPSTDTHMCATMSSKVNRHIEVVCGFDHDITGERGKGFLGPRHEHHGLLGHSHYFSGYDAKEVHYTKALSKLLSPSVRGDIARYRVISFVSALYLASGSPKTVIDNISILSDIDVSSEEQFSDNESKYRVDIHIRWLDVNKLQNSLIIEAKFGAAIRYDAQLAYTNFAMSCAGSIERTHLFLLINNIDDGLADKHPEWRQVTWFAVLRRWERLLHQQPAIDDDEFFSFRSALWDRVTLAS